MLKHFSDGVLVPRARSLGVTLELPKIGTVYWRARSYFDVQNELIGGYGNDLSFGSDTGAFSSTLSSHYVSKCIDLYCALNRTVSP